MTDSLQDRYAPKSRCFGCGPANQQGLRIKSRVEGEKLVADWTPQGYHEAFPGVVNGGIIGALLDCHSNWTAAWHLMHKSGAQELPSTVTSEFHVKLRRPTPSNAALRLEARVVEASADRAVVEAEILSGGKVTSSCRGVFVAVQPGHPAYHRWD
jgi:acyl-coenzyme A thioesterase PaaI-like protein